MTGISEMYISKRCQDDGREGWVRFDNRIFLHGLNSYYEIWIIFSDCSLLSWCRQLDVWISKKKPLRHVHVLVFWNKKWVLAKQIWNHNIYTLTFYMLERCSFFVCETNHRSSTKQLFQLFTRSLKCFIWVSVVIMSKYFKTNACVIMLFTNSYWFQFLDLTYFTCKLMR